MIACVWRPPAAGAACTFHETRSGRALNVNLAMTTGADLLVRELHRHGVRVLFGMPGSHTTAIYDERPSTLEERQSWFGSRLRQCRVFSTRSLLAPAAALRF